MSQFFKPIMRYQHRVNKVHATCMFTVHTEVCNSKERTWPVTDHSGKQERCCALSAHVQSVCFILGPEEITSSYQQGCKRLELKIWSNVNVNAWFLLGSFNEGERSPDSSRRNIRMWIKCKSLISNFSDKSNSSILIIHYKWTEHFSLTSR